MAKEKAVLSPPETQIEMARSKYFLEASRFPEAVSRFPRLLKIAATKRLRIRFIQYGLETYL